MSSTSRKPAPRIARPAARYRKGQIPQGAGELRDSDSDSEDQQDVQEQEADIAIGNEDFVTRQDETTLRPSVKTGTAKSINIALKDVDISTDGKVIVAGRVESGRTAMEESEEEESEEEAKPELSKEEDESSEEEESSEDEEEQPKVLFRPKFIPKRGRATIEQRDALAQDSEIALKKKDLEAEERKKQSHDLVAESIKRELAEKEKEEQIPDVDDTDGLDPDAEFEAWRLRELARIKRDKEEEVRREIEREEIERRRALPEEQRLREDMERAQKTREEKPKGKQEFLQKYWHKGAFHQDHEILKRHDFTEKTESTVDVTMLPEVMQVRNFGKRSRTKYTHLVDQDTTIATGGFGGIKALAKPGGMPNNPNAGCFICGGPHMKKDCPQASGANMPPLGQRDRGKDDRPRRSWRDDDEKKFESRDRGRADGGYRERERADEYSHRRRDRDDLRSRSRSPPSRQDWQRDGPRQKERVHSRERSADRDHYEKRRRTDY